MRVTPCPAGAPRRGGGPALQSAWPRSAIASAGRRGAWATAAAARKFVTKCGPARGRATSTRAPADAQVEAHAEGACRASSRPRRRSARSRPNQTTRPPKRLADRGARAGRRRSGPPRRPARRPSRISALASAMASTEAKNSRWTGATFVMTATSGRAMRGERAELARRRHPQLEHRRRVLRRAGAAG